MIELFEGDKLIVGEKYYVKKKLRYLQICTNSSIPKILIGIYKWHHLGCVAFKLLNYNNPLYVDSDFYVVDIYLNNIYRYVSSEQYYAKVKEKYDLHCLNSVLKRVIDETFEW